MTEELLNQIGIVALARVNAQRAKEAKGIAYGAWEIEHKSLLDSIVTTSFFLAEKETKLRELTLQVYAETGNKKPAPGVGIREIIRLDYEPELARDWAIEHKMALKLDVAAFEKIPQATIATDLSKVLEVN